jgi:hypothetical protein
MPLWKEVLVAKYGNHIVTYADWSHFRIPGSASNWWKDICALESVVDGKNWLVDSMIRKVGNGSSTHFWKTKWIGEDSLSILFPRLFSLTLEKDSMVENLFERDVSGRRWSFAWRRPLFQWELDLLALMLELLESVILTTDVDRWCWVPDEEGIFSVNSAYKLLVNESRPLEDVVSEVPVVFSQIWESPAPSKVIAFSWQLLYDRIPTRDNLVVRHIVAPEASRDCVGCVGALETSSHLFLHCGGVISIWYEIFKWLGIVVVIPPTVAVLFEVVRGAAKNKKIRQGYMLIWHATIWTIWKTRNNVIFANGSFNPKAMVDEIKVLSWKWCLARLKVPPCLFYEWTWDLGNCLLL